MDVKDYRGGVLPEQVWDADPVPHRRLAPGMPAGSATPLAWAHAEYVKLAHSVLDGRPVDRPEPLWARYHGYRPTTYLWYWSPQAPLRRLPAGGRLGICLARPAQVVWWVDEGTEQRLQTRETGLGVQPVRLPEMPPGGRLLRFRLTGDEMPAGEQRVELLAPGPPSTRTLRSKFSDASPTQNR